MFSDQTVRKTSLSAKDCFSLKVKSAPFEVSCPLYNRLKVHLKQTYLLSVLQVNPTDNVRHSGLIVF